jgi:RNA polymerase primary sigma factor
MTAIAGAQSTNTMDIYMSEVKQYPLLSAEQEIDLAQQYERGRSAERRLVDASSLSVAEQRALAKEVELGQQARERLIRCNLRLVVSIAHKYSGLGLLPIDLIQEGNIGLIEAVEGYDPDRGTRFSTYAWWWIKQRIRRALTNKSRLVRFPAHVRAELRQLRQASRGFESRFKRRPTAQELTEQLGMQLAKVRRLLRLQQSKTLSLQMPVGDEGDSELGDLIPDSNTPSMEDIYAKSHMRKSVRDLVASHLSPREQKVVRLRFGLDGRQAKTLRQIANELNVSRERVRQIEARALRRLRYAGVQLKLRKTWLDA